MAFTSMLWVLIFSSLFFSVKGSPTTKVKQNIIGRNKYYPSLMLFKDVMERFPISWRVDWLFPEKNVITESRA